MTFFTKFDFLKVHFKSGFNNWHLQKYDENYYTFFIISNQVFKGLSLNMVYKLSNLLSSLQR